MPTVGEFFRPVQRARISASIVAQVRALLADRRLQPGGRLPPERDLARHLGVGRTTLREAMRSLEFLGVVETRSGEGTFLRAAEPLTILPGALGSATQQAALLEARLLVEPEVAALAAQRATPEQLRDAQHLLAAQAADVAAGGRGTEADVAFHTLLYQMAGNMVLEHLHAGLDAVLRAGRERVHAAPGRALASLREHQGIFAALAARDAAGARETMAGHLTAVSAVVAALAASDATPEEVPAAD